MENADALSAESLEHICKRAAAVAFDLHLAELLRLKANFEMLNNEATAYWFGVAAARLMEKRDSILQDVIGAMWQHELAETLHGVSTIQRRISDITGREDATLFLE